MEIIGAIWVQVLLRPMLNSLLFLYVILGGNFGLSIIAFTVVVRLLMYPLTRKQVNATRAMSRLQPQIREIQRKYGKDRERVSKEMMRLYKEEGINPIGCLGPMLIQLPIWIGLYQSVLQALPKNPERLVDLSQKLYSWMPNVHQTVPLNSGFLWLDLSEPDPTRFVLPVLVGASMWVLQKISTTSAAPADPRQASMNRMMLWMMPVMFGMFTLGFPSGLALYWVVSNVIGIALQYRATGWGALVSAPGPAVETQSAQETEAETSKEMVADGEPGSDGQDSGGGDRAGAETARRRARRSRRRRRHRR